ncbi:CAMK/CAMKL/LKB protein kinase [Sphaeroforma arctica JP610]|uniref:non-specific serine/threonine protein kinase n=1 Tax=Sphaeroforma arctica JP610 TaxID=667725 RepID=A0A0L0G2K5_9EUKA|nr:CAMK/CAMKL/LKB protein kinase [Sphaeroforma arctica JP610]KNC83310.1 CAMK/CAMKL/LKB protein kinase [Sphaeroforma arctica JP610]|eukprot:XP_014157212.1 CAMK/CAMKL/LKB protein kinase [Sphaeroforma arctica JP610]
MEYCIGGLQEMIDNCENGLPIWQAHSYFVQLVDGINYIHSRGVIHRDIKPSNLLLSREGDIKICDFGVAEELDTYAPTDRCTSSAGSPAFQAPEIAAGKPEYCGFKVDVWALGITLYNLTTGEYPFNGDNIYDLFENISACKYTVPDHIDDFLRDLILNILCEDVEKRFSLDQIMHHEWYMGSPDKSDPAAPLPVADIYNSTTLIPYLEELYDDVEDDDDNVSTRLEVNSGWVPAAGRESTNFHDNLEAGGHHLNPQRGTQCYGEQPKSTSPRTADLERGSNPGHKGTTREENTIRLTKSRSTMNANVQRKSVKKVGSKCSPM